jgi:hypothetical protein
MLPHPSFATIIIFLFFYFQKKITLLTHIESLFLYMVGWFDNTDILLINKYALAHRQTNIKCQIEIKRSFEQRMNI